MLLRRGWLAFSILPAVLIALPAFAQSPSVVTAGDRIKQGHSVHGEAFDTGPRARPWVMEGIGRTHFPHHHEEPRSAAMVRPGQHPAPLVLGHRGRARLPLVLEAGAGERDVLLGALPRHRLRCRALRRVPARGGEAQGQRVRAGTPLHRGAGGALGPARLARPWDLRRRRARGRVPQEARDHLPEVSRRHGGAGAPRLRGDGGCALRHRAHRPRDPGQAARPSGGPPLPHPQLERPRARAGSRELPALLGDRPRHSPRAAHARAHLRYRGHVERGRDQHGVGHAGRDRVHARPPGLPLQPLELRPQSELPLLYPGAARDGGGRALRRAPAHRRSPRSQAQQRCALRQPHPGNDGHAARAREVRALGPHPRRPDLPLARHLRGQDEPGLRADPGLARQGRPAEGGEGAGPPRRSQEGPRQERGLEEHLRGPGPGAARPDRPGPGRDPRGPGPPGRRRRAAVRAPAGPERPARSIRSCFTSAWAAPISTRRAPRSRRRPSTRP